LTGKNVSVGAIVSIALGLAVTVVTGLFRTLGTGMGVDFITRGTPFAWNTQVFPEPEHIIWLGFLTDLAFWILVFLAVSLAILTYLNRRHSIHQ